ncbi:MAG: uracil-DNA glycosylase family protein [Bacillota bacterium]
MVPARNPFVCGTRRTLQSAAQEAGLRLADLYVTWVLKCSPLRAYDKEASRTACLPYLGQQVNRGDTRVLVSLGNVALRSVLGDPALEVKALRGRVLRYGALPTLCSYHPLAARRRPSLLPLVIDDLRLAARIAGGGA